MDQVAFKIVVPSYNSSQWLSTCLQSIADQTYPHLDVCVIDDASTEEEQRTIIAQYVTANGWKAIYNKVNQGTLHNLVEGTKALECNDDDVVIVVDGDDWLAHSCVLESLAFVYRSTGALMTYGQYMHLSTGETGCPRPYSSWTRFWRAYRKKAWRLSHLRTYKYLLWRQIKDKDLRDEQGNYLQVAADLATMFPMAEMAGRHLHFIPEVMYVYNDLNPIGDEKIHRAEQLRVNRQLRSKRRYSQLSLR